MTFLKKRLSLSSNIIFFNIPFSITEITVIYIMQPQSQDKWQKSMIPPAGGKQKFHRKIKNKNPKH